MLGRLKERSRSQVLVLYENEKQILLIFLLYFLIYFLYYATVLLNICMTASTVKSLQLPSLSGLVKQ